MHLSERAKGRAKGRGERVRRKRDIDRAKEKKKKAREKLFPPFSPGTRWSQNPSIRIDNVANLSSKLQPHRMCYISYARQFSQGRQGARPGTSQVSLMAVGSLLYFCLVQKVHVENYTCEYGTLSYARQASTETLSRIERRVKSCCIRSVKSLLDTSIGRKGKKRNKKTSREDRFDSWKKI